MQSKNLLTPELLPRLASLPSYRLMDVDSKTGLKPEDLRLSLSLLLAFQLFATLPVMVKTQYSLVRQFGLDACFPVAGGTNIEAAGSSRSIESTTACSVVAIYA